MEELCRLGASTFCIAPGKAQWGSERGGEETSGEWSEVGGTELGRERFGARGGGGGAREVGHVAWLQKKQVPGLSWSLPNRHRAAGRNLSLAGIVLIALSEVVSCSLCLCGPPAVVLSVYKV